MYKNIINRIKAKQFSVGIIGLGYVGLPLAIKFINNNVKVYGIDNDKKKILSLRKGISYIKSISDHKILYFKKNQNFIDWNYKILSAVDVIIICLPTPLKKNKDPDLSYIFDCLNNLFFYLQDFLFLVNNLNKNRVPL